MTDDKEVDEFEAYNHLYISYIFMWFSITLEYMMQFRGQCNVYKYVCVCVCVCVRLNVCNIFFYHHVSMLLGGDCFVFDDDDDKFN